MITRLLRDLALFSFLMIASGLVCTQLVAAEITVFAGAASKPATEEVVKAFEKKEGVKVNITFGGSGFVLSQMSLAKKGDIYFPGSSDYMEIAKKKGLVFPESEKYIVYLVPAINVQKGNPKDIKTLKDLAKPGVNIAIANPDGVCVGLYAVETIEKNFSKAERAAIKKNIINYTESCEKTATAISLKAVDAVIGWRVFQYWDPARIETVPLKKSEVTRVGYIPIAISTFTTQKELAQRFIDFILSDEGKRIFKKYHYFMTPDEAFKWIGERKPVGGEYKLPANWIKK